MVRTSGVNPSGSDTASRRRRRSPVQIWAGPPSSILIRGGGFGTSSTLNRRLFVFSLLLMVAGFVSGIYLVSLIGLLLLIPSLASPSQAPARKPPPQTSQPSQPPRRAAPPVHKPPPPAQMSSPKTEPATPPAQEMTYMSTSPSVPSMQPLSYTPALFPSPMLPSLSLMGSPPSQAKAPQEVRREREDELVEVGAMLALLKLVLG